MATVLPTDDSPFASEPPKVWSRIDQWLERGGERLNPILVKEARQALKSRQFLITFTLLLVCGWGWSMVGVVLQGPAIYYSASGPPLLAGFFFILAVPLLLIVPFVAYRSLAAEREDGTYELLSITNLSARQIITGKLGSAVLQMMVFYSALAPCIAFTYLLRGVDILTILFMLFYLFLASLMFAAIGLLVATLTRSRHIQVLLSVVLLIGLIAATLTGITWLSVAVFQFGSFPHDDKYFWIGNFAFLTFYSTMMALILLASAAHISFASDNRSTKLRVVMFIQQIMICCWMTYLYLEEPYVGVLEVLLAITAIHWAILGAILTGEWAELSPRVRRALPKTVLGRVFLTWFNPGSGTGYVFAIANLMTVALYGWGVGLIGQALGVARGTYGVDHYLFGVMTCSYVIAYLGLGRLIVLGLRKYLYFGLMLPVLLHIILALLGCAIPVFVQAWFDDFNRLEYSGLMFTNWAWTLAEIVDGGVMSSHWEVPILVVSGAVAIFFVNLIYAAKEVEQTRQEAPQRVLEDEIMLHPERSPEGKPPRSPWDDDE